jgi:hypothetical protein
MIHEFAGEAETLCAVENPVPLSGDGGLVGLAKPGRRFDERLKNGFELKGRTTDDLQHVSRRGLLLQGFSQILRACLHLVEQAHVLDRYHRLIGEGRGELDVPFVERLHFFAGN